MDDSTQPSLYTAVGGGDTFRRLVGRFYELVTGDPLLRPIYPGTDLGPAEEHLRLFLIQYWGGPHTYRELRGHPRLRMRHAPFRIGAAERDAWLRHMRTAMDELKLDPRPRPAAVGLPGDGGLQHGQRPGSQRRRQKNPPARPVVNPQNLRFPPERPKIISLNGCAT